MADKQNPRCDDEDSAPAPAVESVREKDGAAPGSYYYDDATGYEVYEAEDEGDEDVDEPDG
jgi:hypothetical protein